jgi:hypothetical protein
LSRLALLISILAFLHHKLSVAALSTAVALSSFLKSHVSFVANPFHNLSYTVSESLSNLFVNVIVISNPSFFHPYSRMSIEKYSMIPRSKALILSLKTVATSRIPRRFYPSSPLQPCTPVLSAGPSRVKPLDYLLH